MKNFNVPDISIYQMQMFITVADEQNFSRAARIMHLTQPTLSKRILAIENAIGLRLFNRQTRPIQLTREGEVLYSQWMKICDLFKESIDEAFKNQKRKARILNVCWYDSGNMLAALPLVGKQLIQIHSDLAFRLSYSPFMKWRNLIMNNNVDVMITIRMESDYLSEELEWEEINTCPELIVMLETNPLCQKKQITYEDLKTQKFVVLSPVEFPIYENYVQRICKEQGFTPQIARYAPNANSFISSLQNDNEVLVCDQFLRNIDSPLIKYFELPDTYSGLIAVWKKKKTTQYLIDYVKLLRNYCADFPL